MESVVIATPSRGTVAIEYMVSMRETMTALCARGIPYGFIETTGNPFIGLARDQLVAAFLSRFTETDNLFFIDDDLGWPAEKVIEFILRPQPIVAGVYRMKQEQVEFPCNLAVDSSGKIIRNDGMVKALMAPIGFCRIKRVVLEDLAAKSRVYRESGPNLSYDGPIYEIFEQGIDSRNLFCGEDVAFVRKALAAGFDVWVDPDIEFTHRGHWPLRGRYDDIIKVKT